MRSIIEGRFVGSARDSRNSMEISRVTPQLRTTDLSASIEFFTEKLGFVFEFQYEDFYAGVRCGQYVVHLKLVDEPDPSIEFAARDEHFHLYLESPDVNAAAESLERSGVRILKPAHDTAWGTRECVIEDNVGHILYFGQRL